MSDEVDDGDDAWRARFWEAIAQDGRKLRAISMAAKLGENYLTQTKTRKSAPTINKFVAILNELGTASSLYVLTGVRMDETTARFINAASALPPELVEDAARLFEGMRAQRDTGSRPRGRRD